MTPRREQWPSRLGTGARPAELPTRPLLAWVALAATFTAAAAACVVAIIAPAPAAAAPFVAIVCVGCPLLAGQGCAPALASLREHRAGRRALAGLRSALDHLPETEHPLGL
jgi:hypothetical protein